MREARGGFNQIIQDRIHDVFIYPLYLIKGKHF